MIKFLLELFVLYIIYKFVFELVLPVYHTTKEVKRKMQSFQEQMNKGAAVNQEGPQGNRNPHSKTDHGEDYIEFEEIK